MVEPDALLANVKDTGPAGEHAPEPVREHPAVARYLIAAPSQPGRIPANHIVLGDAIEVLAGLPDDSVGLVHTSPPYNINRPYASGASDRSATNEYVDFLGKAIDHLKRVVRPGGSVFWQTGYTKDDVEPRGIVPIDMLSYDLFRSGEAPFVLWDRIIWRYWGGHAFTRKFTNKHETILWFVKQGAEPAFLVDEVRERSKEYDKRNNFWGRNPGNVWEVDRVAFGSTDQTSHVAVFPEELTERIVRACSVPGELVLDPFAGSGTVPKVAHGLGRPWLGIEISPLYAAEASLRIGFQQPSEADSLASGLVKHIAFKDKPGTLPLAEAGRTLSAWAARCPVGQLRESLTADIASVFGDKNGRNAAKSAVQAEYDDMIARPSDDPVVLADRLLGQSYKLRQRFNGVKRYQSALTALEALAAGIAGSDGARYVARIASQEPSSFRVTGDLLAFVAPKRSIGAAAGRVRPSGAAPADGEESFQSRLSL